MIATQCPILNRCNTVTQMNCTKRGRRQVLADGDSITSIDCNYFSIILGDVCGKHHGNCTVCGYIGFCDRTERATFKASKRRRRK